VLVTYDAHGGYGHPDHIQAHRVAWRACELAGPDAPAKLYATATLGSEQSTTEIDAGAYFDRKLAAMRAHATQITVDPPFFALSDGVRRQTSGTEYYALLAGARGDHRHPFPSPAAAPPPPRRTRDRPVHRPRFGGARWGLRAGTVTCSLWHPPCPGEQGFRPLTHRAGGKQSRFAVHRPGIPDASPRSHRVPCGDVPTEQ
jgi:hypothetical protein